MARKFFTPISLTGLELQNFKIQNLADNPSPYGAGHSYYNTVAKELRIYDGTNWVPVGGSVEYGTYAALPAAGNNGRVYATTDTQTLYLDYNNAWLQIGASGSATYVNSVNGTSNQVTVNNSTGDVTARLDYNVKIDADLQVGGFTDEDNGSFSVQTYNNIKAFEVTTNVNPSGQYHGYNTYTNATGVINVNSLINLGSENAAPSGLLFANAAGGASGFPTVHLEAYGDLALRAGANGNDGNIILYTGSTSGPGTGKVYIGWNNAGGAGANASNQVATIGDIASNGYITSVDTANFTVTSNQLLLNSEIFVDTISSLNSREDTLSIYGGYSNIVLNGSNGNIELSPDGLVTVNSALTVSSGYNLTVGNNVYVKNGIYAGGSDTVTDGYLYIKDAAGNNLIGLSGTNGSGTIETHGVLNLYRGYNDGGNQYASFYSDSDTNLIINANNNNIILASDSSRAYIGSVTDGNKIATMSDVNAAAQGLSVLGSVRIATSANIDVNTIDGTIDGVTLGGQDRILLKSQDDPTQNGIYIYGPTNTITLSTNPSDMDIKEGSFVFVEEGTHAAQGWIVTAFSSGASTWTQFSAAGEYTAGYGIDISGGSISVKLDSDSLSESGSGLKVNYHTDGGLDNDSGLYVKTANGVTIDNSGNVTIDTTIVARRYASTITPASPFTDYDFPINHGLGTDVIVQVWDTYSNGGANQLVDVDYYTITDNGGTTIVEFAVPPTDGQVYRVVVVG